jgi:3-phosphoshikimate 1-carboxyvinyltransferase
MRERPLGELIDALRALGVVVRSELDNQRPPVVIERAPGRFAGGAATVYAHRSSQFVSALLLPAPLWKHGLRLRVIGEAGRPFVEMTLRLMERWGVETRLEGESIVISGGQRYLPQLFQVESDASSASYFAAAAILCGGSVVIENIDRGSIQGDLRFLEILGRMGAEVRWSVNAVEVIGGGTFRGIDLDMSHMPDMVPTLAAIAPFADTPTRIRNVGFIRDHESDRIAALVAELERLGAKVEQFDDGLEVHPSKLHAASIETYDDHRIAMSFAIVGLRLPGVTIEHPSCTAKTYPRFFAQLASLS